MERRTKQMRQIIVRTASSLALVAMLGLTAASTSAQQLPRGPTVVVANPNAGDMITPGAFTMQGVAFDNTATTGVGVDRVTVFLGDRDAGGMFLGDAKLGAPTTMPVPSDQFAMAGWTLVTPALGGAGELNELRVYARSEVTGLETVVDIPITIGETTAPSRGGVGDVPGVVHDEPAMGGPATDEIPNQQGID
jgi:hypothetical protein